MNNRELFEMLFDVLFEHDPDFIEASKKTDAMVSELVEGVVYEVTQDEEEAISGGILDIVGEARRDGFILGTKYAVKAIFHLLSN